MIILILGIAAALGIVVAAIHSLIGLPVWAAILIVLALGYIIIHFL